MVLHPQSIKAIPLLTKEIARQAFPKGNLYMTLRDELGSFYNDSDFAELYSTEGQPALHPWRLALVCVKNYYQKNTWLILVMWMALCWLAASKNMILN